MKSLFLSAVFLMSATAFACSPQAPANAQIGSLQRVLDSEALRNEIRKAQVNDIWVQIKSINVSTLTVTLSNDCKIESKLLWKPVSQQMPGMCPQFDRVKSKTVCP